ncbi:MAG: RecQ family ATP-dependent DNA helicase [Desulfobacula sp.]|nr:RecQ family ATP-dependent DNA helicase [Desulfobacula sp.]
MKNKPPLFENILSLDFEMIPNGDLYQIGAVLNDKTFQRKDIKNVKSVLMELSQFSKNADYILGHNIVKHDLPVAKNLFPEAGFLTLPVIDTLFLSPLAFPENPYHKLVKNYKLIKSSKNDPVSDAKLAMAIFEDQVAAFSELRQREPGLIAFYAFAFEDDGSGRSRLCLKGNFDLFQKLSGRTPDWQEAKDVFQGLAKGKVCETGLGEIWDVCSDNADKRAMLAYVLSWIMVSGGNSIIPPWVKHEFPHIFDIIRKLRYSCSDESCCYCRDHNDSKGLLKKYFGFETYRALADGRTLQKEIIDSNLAGNPILGILPTGGGKSICYQIPALHRYERLGELTIVISPLKALMKDQVDNLNRATRTQTAASINGSLTLPERGAVMDKVRLGDIGILYISPEQLRNFSVAQLIKSRDVGCWVFDEAHCLSKWGHDFRPDYLHVSDFIAHYCKICSRPALVGAYTATAKKDVIEEILSHCREKLSIDLESFTASIQRENLSFQVWPVTRNEKYDVIYNCLQESLAGNNGGAIVYCSSRRHTEELSLFLNEKRIHSKAFHAGRNEPDKRNIQDDFIEGKIPVICATNAFGMGIDKKDIRLVIHADIPGSLENYLQEAGRAGRDMEPSDCILLYEQEDIENQFSLNAYSKLSIKDIKKILAILKKRGAKTPEIIITPGEIMRLIGHKDPGGNDSKARIGVSWLERKGFVERSYNQTLFFKGVPAVKNIEQAVLKMEQLHLSKMMKTVFIRILNFLFNADSNSLLSADDICTDLGKIKDLPEKYLDSRHIISLLSDMAKAGLIREGVVMTAFVRPKGKNSSPKNFDYFCDVEKQIIHIMEEMAPDSWLTQDRADIFNLRLMSQRLKDRGFDRINPDFVERILRSIANDKEESFGKSLKITGMRGADQLKVYVKFSWQEIRQRAELRHRASRIILETIIFCLPANLRSGQAEVLAQFFITDIMDAMGNDIFLSGFKGDIRSLIERCLLYMHDVKIITLQNGLGVFRQAMTLTMLPESRNRQYTKGDYEPLSHHYDQKNVQVHVMEKFARLGLEKIKTALNFVSDYFSSSNDSFVSQYFPGEQKIIQTAMTQDAYKRIVQSLENNIQETIVAAEPEKNLLVLAGPGSGKTKTIVHRCAWLIKAKSVDPSSILILCFNHQTMLELKKRIKKIAGQSADFVTAMTYHGFAMRLTGRSFMGNSFNDNPGEGKLGFDDIIDEAIDILTGNKEFAGIDPSEAREYYLAGFRYILVDEYQDIDERQYRFISALTGRLEQDTDARISIMAVGDDDQSIYGFRNANVAFIKQFKQDYDAKTFYLVENYRSSYPIIQASASFIAQNENRMKKNQSCRINRKRKVWEKKPENLDKMDCVQIIHAADIASQANFVAETIKKILNLHPEINPADIAILSRQGIAYPSLVAVRMTLAKENISFCYSIKSNAGFPMFKIREIQSFITYLDTFRKKSQRPYDLKQEVMALFKQKNTWTNQIEVILESWCRINSDMEISIARAKDFVLETFLEEKREHKTGNGVFMGTIHSVKGMEFSIVFILDGGWKHLDIEEERRLFYVGMTRAKERLFLCHIDNMSNPHIRSLKGNGFVFERATKPAQINDFSDDLTISILGLADIYLNYPGLFQEGHKIHRYLTELEAGAKVRLKEQKNQVYICNDANQIIASLSKNGSAQWRNQTRNILNARVLGIIRRHQQENEENSYKKVQVESWELPIVEILHKKFKKGCIKPDGGR